MRTTRVAKAFAAATVVMALMALGAWPTPAPPSPGWWPPTAEVVDQFTEDEDVDEPGDDTYGYGSWSPLFGNPNLTYAF